MELKTPLYDQHVACGGRITPFAGYLLPVQYESGIIAEHMAVRTKAGLFDVSHMGEVIFSGPDALQTLNYLLTNDFTDMSDGQVRYSPMCNEEGGIVDDILIYKMNDHKYMMVVNASNRDKDVAWMRTRLQGDVEMKDISDSMAELALQGPFAYEILSRIADEQNIPAKYYTFIEEGTIGGMDCIISKTGYTGENGYELYLSNEDAPKMWNLLLDKGKEFGLIPCGLGARDTLRLEAAMPLYGHEMDDTVNPLETGLGFAVKMTKPDFIGKEAIQSKLPLTRKRVGLKITGRGIAREQAKVYVDDKQIGFTTSGTYCPFLSYAAAMALLDIDCAEPGTVVQVEVRGNRIDAVVVPLPFYKIKR